jgi:hypothetical protein
MAEYVKQGSPEHLALMKEWYGDTGKLAKSGFQDIETFDPDMKPYDEMRGDPSKPNPLDLTHTLDSSEIVGADGSYEYHYRFRERARELEVADKHNDEWMLCLLIGEGWSHTDIARALDISSSTIDRRVNVLVTELIGRR